MKHPNIKRLDILWQDGIPSRAFVGIITGLWDILKLAGVAGQLPIVSRGMVLRPFWLIGKNEPLSTRVDVEPFLKAGRQESKRDGCLNGVAILKALLQIPVYQNKERYALLMVKEKIHWDDPDEYRKIGGCGFPERAAVISLAYFMQNLNSALGLLHTRMIAIHEMGHVFRLGAPEKEVATHEESDNGHCQNACAMSLCVEFSFLQSIQANPLCPPCLEKLKKYFTEMP